MSMALVIAVLLCVIAIVMGIALIAYGFRRAGGGGKK
jgi:hypothetical protein